MTEEHAFIEWKAEQYKHQDTEEEMEFVEHLHNFPRYFKKTFLEGYHECQKEHEWHYVKDGDFPTKITENKYLVALKSEYGGFFYETDIWCNYLHCFASNNPTKVYAWKEIVPPKEIE